MALEKFPNLIKQAFGEWRKQRTESGESVSMIAFAEYLNVSKGTVSLWITKGQIPDLTTVERIIDKLVPLVGQRVYDALGLVRPNPTIEYILKNWDHLSPETRNKVEKLIRDDQSRVHHGDNPEPDVP